MSESRTMTDLVEAYLESRHRLGVKLHFEGWALRSFARYADDCAPGNVCSRWG